MYGGSQLTASGAAVVVGGAVGNDVTGAVGCDVVTTGGLVAEPVGGLAVGFALGMSPMATPLAVSCGVAVAVAEGGGVAATVADGRALGSLVAAPAVEGVPLRSVNAPTRMASESKRNAAPRMPA